MRQTISVLLVLLAALAAVAPGAHAASSTLDRPQDPVVLTGADLLWYAGVDPADIVAFRWKGSWQQVPVQVDERATLDFCDVYGIGGGGAAEAAGQAYAKPCGVTNLFYTDAGTFTGADPNATLDADDELVFMSKDAGAEAPAASYPVGTVNPSRLDVRITDPLDAGAEGYVYLFLTDGSLSPGAGQQYVTYTFNLLSGPYLTTYNALNGPNPENSTATTASYAHHFSDRWINDELHITAGSATGVDILDRHKALFAPGVCGRHEETFSNGEGAFVTNKSGPVRAIRSYVGANSGPLTQREHVFYEQRQDIRTYLRVHAISGMMDFFDYAPAVAGMTYRNDLNTGGVTIDGTDDSVTLGAIRWELVSGGQGSLVMSQRFVQNIAGFAYTSYYLDDSTPPVTQCTGDAFSYGSSGPRITQAIPCTDPAQSCTSSLANFRTMYYAGPGLTATDAEALYDESTTPLAYSVTADATVGGLAGAPQMTPPNGGRSLGWALASLSLLGLLAGGILLTRRRGNAH
jgi:hypothetical protein